MSELRENVRQVLVKLVPASVINDIACFVFYDNHPKDEKKIDVTICTKKGEVKEYYQRDLVDNIKLDIRPTQIRILRNNNCELYYLVEANENIIILSRKSTLKVHVKLSDVERCDINDNSCRGQASLRVFCKGDAIPITFTDSYEKPHELSESFSPAESDESYPIISQLKRKLIEAKYSVKCNEKTYKDLLNMRQTVAYSAYKKINPNIDDALSKEESKEIASALKMTMEAPWIKVYNNKIVIVLNVENLSNETLEDVHIILHSASNQAIEYTTKLFTPTDYLLHWEERATQTIQGHINTAIVVVIDVDELKSRVVSNIHFNGVVYYMKMGKEHVVPFSDVHISSMDALAEEFDVFSSGELDTNSLLAVLAATEKTDLILRHINQPNDGRLTLDTFCEYLYMDKVLSGNVAIHKKSPYHVLNGVMIVLHGTGNSNCYSMSVYSRTPSQVLALIHYIHDAVPYTIIITTLNYKLTAKDNTLSEYNEDILESTQKLHNYQNYINSITTRSKIALKYLDESLLKMNESKNPIVQSKVGSEIDIFAGGEPAYLEFKKRMREEASKVLEMENEIIDVVSSEEMCVD
ncbi:uncharacterized protein LOC113504477 [Trichoplusia ni]|uniref:Uncharacterized protein LOC113504477 n=1 Tax=Trichoplusia ni TaxID=7111 RepID=A0A7E5WPE3_TRINI|nr:uncharacterized protein LOC113504477 [Trichoplusia ni]